MKIRYIFVILILIIIFLIFYRTISLYDFLPVSKDYNAKSNIGLVNVYEAPDHNLIIIWNGWSLKVNLLNKHVSLISNYSLRFFCYTFWPKNSYKGVILGDGVKGNLNDKYYFRDKEIDVLYHYGLNDNDVVEIYIKKLL